MCRIAGIIDFANPLVIHAMDDMRNCMRHGGPDDGGSFVDDEWPLALGVRRLALLDLTTAGHQPMLSPCGSLVLAFNGELYNYASIKEDLKALGHQFKTQTDTEVVLQAYQQWGTDCFNRFNGMFGLCIWDKQRQQVVLARDHAGMKPLYYFFDKAKRQLYFASEVRAFKTLRPNWPEDADWRIRLLAYGHMPEPHTTLEGVKTLAAGHQLVLHLPQFGSHISQWYQPAHRPLITDVGTARAALHSTLKAAVQRHLVADAPLGVFLSGGTDSSLLSILAAKVLPPTHLHTVSLVFEEPGYSEQTYQAMVATQTASQHHAFVVSQSMFQDSLPDILQAMDQPSNDGINAYFISKFARQAGLTAVLSGVGADELFGGYDTFGWGNRTQKLKKLPGWALAMAWMAPNDRLKRISFLKQRGTDAEYLFYRGFFAPRQIAQLLGTTAADVNKVLFGDHQPQQVDAATTLHDAQHISGLEQRYYMRNQLLRDADAMGMWHSLEIRLPFLDRQVVELCNSVAPHIRFPAAGKKQFLIKTFENELPPAIWQRKKMGFTLPFHVWTQRATLAGAADERLQVIEKRFKAGEIRWSRYWAYLLSTRQHIEFTPPQKKVLFLSLTTFSAVGGIQKFNRCFCLALQQQAALLHWQVAHASVYDTACTPRYFGSSGFMGFAQKKLAFAWHVLRTAHCYDLIIVGHINLAKLMWVAQRVTNAKFWWMAHGVEVWQPLGGLSATMLQKADKILSVSRFTAEKLVSVQGVDAAKVVLFPNTIDPFFKAELPLQKAPLRSQYGIESAGGPVLLTVARLASSEKYKGYDDVLRALPQVMAQLGPITYVLAGTADPLEEERIKHLAEELGVSQWLRLTGFVLEDDLPHLFQMADVFVMPSKKEGFGIVFIEAASCGLPLIGGNEDGSVDALLNGQLGKLIEPGNVAQISQAIIQTLQNPLSRAAQTEQAKKVSQHFGFEVFSQRLLHLLCKTPD